MESGYLTSPALPTMALEENGFFFVNEIKSIYTEYTSEISVP